MQAIEVAIVGWFIENFGERCPELRRQLEVASIVEREFTSGGGVFLSHEVREGAPIRTPGEEFRLDGPEIRASELECGALASIHFSNGRASCIEIWSYANDYPIGRHPTGFSLVEPDINLIDLRDEF